uniref:Uncharacterized protein n=1 Tax=Phakopsora pachyrhizi TaxID=170000 RepID=A0A0S1MKN6_PHAPC
MLKLLLAVFIPFFNLHDLRFSSLLDLEVVSMPTSFFLPFFIN